MSDPSAAARRFSGGPPAWVFLEEFASFGDVRNATTATGVTTAGCAVDVSFELVDPPGVSRWFVHCPGLEEGRGFNGSPQILNAAGALVVMRMLFFAHRGRVIDYLVYRAGPERPSLDLIPGPCPKVFLPKQVGVVPRRAGAGVDGDRGHYSVVFPVQRLDPSLQLEIFVFSSETRAWSSRVAKFSWDEETKTTYDAVVMHTPTKAVAAGGGSLARIDLWRGVLLCEWLDDGQPVLRLIQWPVPPPRDVPIDMASPVGLRDATMSDDGVIRFVELQLCYDGPDGSGYFSFSNDGTGDHGWTATVWKRETSSVHWGISLRADTDNIFAADSRSSSCLLRKMRDDGGVNELADLKKLVSAAPRLSLEDEDVVYIEARTRIRPGDSKSLLLAVNAREERIEAPEQITLRLRLSRCTFSRFLDASPACDL